MKKVMAGCLVLALLLTISLAPSDAWANGHVHRGGGHFGFWGPGLVLGGLALGAAVSAPYYYRYGSPYYYGYGPDYYYAPPPAVVYQQAPPAYAAAPPPPVQREVVYPHGKYVLYGDGVTQAWQWVWVPNAPASPPPPPPAR